jgi:hypothetical protein
MGIDLLTILEIAGIFGLALWFTGFCALFVGVRKARREFRVKGFLRPPSGMDWFRFLLMRQYEYFETPSIRFYFGAGHVCMIGFFIVAAAVLVFVGSELLLNGINGFSPGGPGAPTIPLSQ